MVGGRRQGVPFRGRKIFISYKFGKLAATGMRCGRRGTHKSGTPIFVLEWQSFDIRAA